MCRATMDHKYKNSTHGRINGLPKRTCFTHGIWEGDEGRLWTMISCSTRVVDVRLSHFFLRRYPHSFCNGQLLRHHPSRIEEREGFLPTLLNCPSKVPYCCVFLLPLPHPCSSSHLLLLCHPIHATVSSQWQSSKIHFDVTHSVVCISYRQRQMLEHYLVVTSTVLYGCLLCQNTPSTNSSCCFEQEWNAFLSATVDFFLVRRVLLLPAPIGFLSFHFHVNHHVPCPIRQDGFGIDSHPLHLRITMVVINSVIPSGRAR